MENTHGKPTETHRKYSRKVPTENPRNTPRENLRKTHRNPTENPRKILTKSIHGKYPQKTHGKPTERVVSDGA